MRVKTVNDAGLESAYTSTEQVTPTNGETLKVWWGDIYPWPFYSATTTTFSIFFQVTTNVGASAVCHRNTAQSLNCPPDTLVSLSWNPNTHDPLELVPTGWGGRQTLRAVATADSSDTAETIRLQYAIGGPRLPEIVVSAGNGKIGVGWSVPATVAPGSAINGYRVRHRAVGSGWPDPPDWETDVTKRAFVIDGLTNDTTYEISVQAGSDVGDVTIKGSITIETLTGLQSGACGTEDRVNFCRVTPSASNAGNPGAPASPSVTAGDAKLAVSWTAPASDGGAAVHAYSVRHKQNSDGDDTYTTTTVYSGADSLDITGLTNSTAYKVQVRAENANGDSGWTTIGTTHTPVSS